ncbi:unnamed protein product [Notodromas monacha]|uniref:KOW domain-containing protein n=1 Tax=Notodromas monacha TaxID=399045 RepID=A0A7R9BDC0_9CRUS|nr:unnamed protein product [Notodromas monacha]CAG0912563.1 unnamed protein product [Notodromas monacha]
MIMESTAKTSFSFARKIEKRDLSETGHERFDKNDEKHEDEAGEVEAPPVKKLVIPVPEDGNWGRMIKKMEAEHATVVVPEGLSKDDELAMKELIAESREELELMENQPKTLTGAIPLNLKEVSDLGVEPSMDDYDSVPIEEFGVAMLRGMGMSEQEYEEIRNKVPSEVRPWPVGVGLGASSKFSRKNRLAFEEGLILKPGKFVVIDSGSRKGRYGKIEGLDADGGKVIIKLAIDGEIITKSEGCVSVVSEDVYNKDSRVINKETYSKYKEEEHSKISLKIKEEKRNGSSENFKQRDKRELAKDTRDPSREARHRSSKDDDTILSSSRRAEQSEPRRDDKVRTWVHPQLRVRMISRSYRDGKYYKEKLLIEDVPSPDYCVCRTEDRKILDDVKPKYLETVVPRHSGDRVMVVTGKHRGRLGSIVELDRESLIAFVQIEHGSIAKLSYDEICQYVT